jgi:hypothetical protein
MAYDLPTMIGSAVHKLCPQRTPSASSTSCRFPNTTSKLAGSYRYLAVSMLKAFGSVCSNLVVLSVGVQEDIYIQKLEASC